MMHECEVCPTDQVTHHFFMLPKEIHKHATKHKIGNTMSDFDWGAIMHEAQALVRSGTSLQVEPYKPGCQPIIIVIQDGWMLSMVFKLPPNNAWTIDSTLKTNQFGLPLYVVVAPNQSGIGMPLWYILCSSETSSGEDQAALAMTLTIVFKRMSKVGPNAIVIDKSLTEFGSIQNFVSST